MAAPRRIYDQRGGLVELGAHLREGGEGAVFDVASNAALVAKLYKQQNIPVEKATKLSWMATSHTPDLLKIAAWPTATLHTAPGGPICGFVMPKIVGFKEVHLLYGPQSRRREFPKADWQFLLHVAMNTAAAFEEIHAHGNLVADVNAGNLLVSPNDATVRLIDCDSFQVRANGQLLLCEVGVPEYTPPELQGHAFRGVVRTENHDRFGLAVLIFHLMFMGRHPFSGRYVGAGDMPPERAISEFRFAFGRAATLKQMSPPPYSLRLDVLPPEVATLFERSFAEAAISGGRPTAQEWRLALASLLKRIVTCAAEPSHKYPSTTTTCPWCEIVGGGGPTFFLSVQVGPIDFVCGVGDLEPILRSLQQLALAPPAATAVAAMAPPTPNALPAAVVAARESTVRATRVMAGGGVGVLAGILFFLALSASWAGFLAVGALAVVAVGYVWRAWLARFSALGAERRRRQDRFSEAQRAVEQLEAQRQGSAAAVQSAAQQLHARVEQLRRDYGGLRPAYEAEFNAEQRNSEATQRRAYLDSYMIEDAVIKGVGRGRKAALFGYGIETAHDVLHGDLSVVPSIGASTKQNLIDWARACESSFRFDANKGVPEMQRRALVSKYRQRQMQTKGHLERAVTELRGLRERWEAEQAATARAVAEERRRAEQAWADLSLL